MAVVIAASAFRWSDAVPNGQRDIDALLLNPYPFERLLVGPHVQLMRPGAAMLLM